MEGGGGEVAWESKKNWLRLVRERSFVGVVARQQLSYSSMLLVARNAALIGTVIRVSNGEMT